MKNEFTIPAKPWNEKDIAFLLANETKLNAELRAELGLDVAVEVGSGSETVVTSNDSVDVTTLTPEEIQEGVDAFNAPPVEDQEAAKAEVEKLQADADVNNTPDNS